MSQGLRHVEAALGRLPPELVPIIDNGGMTGFHGHLRLYGAEAHDVDVVAWNDVQTWKFAWPRTLEHLICIGGTSIGDQWAFERGRPDGPILQLDAFEMDVTQTWSSFSHFMEEFRAWSIAPDDDLLIGAYERYGAMSAGQLLAIAPPIQFGTKDILGRLTLVARLTALVFNGDALTQSLDHPDGRLERVSIDTDALGRLRLRLHWCQATLA